MVRKLTLPLSLVEQLLAEPLLAESPLDQPSIDGPTLTEPLLSESPTMADQNRLAGYKYNEMSNLVLQADKRFTSRRNDEPTGDPESLSGRINIRDMGTRIVRGDTDAAAKKSNKPNIERGDMKEGQDVLERERRKRKRDAPGPSFSLADLDVADLRYHPRTQATRDTYNIIITAVGRRLGDVPAQITISAADAVLETLKDADMKDFDKKREIDDVLGATLSSKDYNDLVNLSKKITDYSEEAQAAGDDDVADEEDVDLDDRQGIAVEFDEDEDVDEDAAETFEVRDDEDTSDEDPDEFAERHGAKGAAAAGGADTNMSGGAIEADDGEVVLDSGLGSGANQKASNKTIVSAHDIDAFWLQREVGKAFDDAHTRSEKTKEVMDILSRESEDGEEAALRDIENDLMELFDFEHNDIVTKLVLNRHRIVWATKWRRAAEDASARKQVEQAIVEKGYGYILDEFKRQTLDGRQSSNSAKGDLMDVDAPELNKDVQMTGVERPEGEKRALKPQRLVNLENLVFDQGNHLMSNAKVELPRGTISNKEKGYEEIIVPAPKQHKPSAGQKNMPTSALPAWARPGFGSSKELNRIQTQCFPMAFNEDGNMLICAPTGSGKTNVAMLTMLREIGKHRNPETGEINLDDFKIIYIAPLKALVQEQTGNFGARLAPYGIKVAELTGDRQLTKHQIAETQVIVTTPEKWDIITRKSNDLSYTNLVRLICIDEIHLLHDERGPVLESIVSRTIRRTVQTGDPVRIVGLSATLPNYHDVAKFLRIDQPYEGLFHFDSSFRPCPLRQEFVGVTDRKPIKQLRTMNDVCYKKVLDQVGEKHNQMLIFVHSRKDTAKTAKYIRDKALEDETMGKILRGDAASREILTSEAESVTNADLKDIMPYGFGIHHAGMSRADRTSVEDLFSDGSIQVLVCTATLAWGVNLPAHTVIIKGTTVYSPEKGSWCELSPQDVLQMLGRAGRPQYDTFGEGIIITTHSEMQYYMSLMNQQLPIESQLISRLVDSLNAEVVLGNVRTRDEGVDWLGFTYLFVRMIRSPGLYSVGAEYADDVDLKQKRVDLIHSAAVALEKTGLVRYDQKSGKLQSTDLGRIASHYYIGNNSVMTYNQHLQLGMNYIEMFRVFSLSEEFKYIPVRQDEKMELARLLTRVPIPVKEGVDEPSAKINVLFQAYISRLNLEGFALMSDLVYVTQSAGRLLRAIFEICLKKGWAADAKMALELCKVAEHRMWPTWSPLRQYPEQSEHGGPYMPRDILQKIERLDVPWNNYFDLDPPRMGELIGLPKSGRLVCNAVEHFPRLDLQATVQPITRSLLHIELVITPMFTWSDELHGGSELFWLIIADCDGEYILFCDQFLLKKSYVQAEAKEHLIEVAVPIGEVRPPHYFINLVSDRWMRAQTKIVLTLSNLVLPEKFPPHTQLLDLQPLPVAAMKREEYIGLYQGWTQFNKIQTQVFNSLFTTDDNVFVGAPVSSGKTICAEFALLRHWSNPEAGRAVYIAPLQELVDNQHGYWKARFANIGGGKSVVKLIGETSADLRLVNEADLVMATPEQWDVLSRGWQRRKQIKSVTLLIADDVHMIGGHNGHAYEAVVSRMNSMSAQIGSNLRIVGLSVSLANAKDIGGWIGATKHTIFNFSPGTRQVPLELHLQSFSNSHFPSLMLAMARPAYQAIMQLSPGKSAMLFVSGRKQVRKTALDLLETCVADDAEDRFLHTDKEEMSRVLVRVREKALAEALSHGVGYYHEALNKFDKQAVRYFFQQGAIQVMVVSRESAFEIDFGAYLVIIMGTQFFEGREHRYIDYPVSDVLQMFGRAGRPGTDKQGRGVLMVPAPKREYYKKFLNEALPVESHLQSFLPDTFVAEISSNAIATTQDAVDWCTYTYFYRRLLANPSFYGVTNTSDEGISTYLSDLVETTLKELEDANIVQVDEDNGSVVPENAARIASYYNISFITIQTFLLSLNGRTRIKALLEIVTSASEFETIPIRRHEDAVLRQVYDRLPVKMSDVSYESPYFKAFILLQAHFARMQLPIDLLEDQRVVLRRVLSLISACTDILSSEGLLNATNAMELSQMVVQGMWDSDSPLLQIPHFGPEQVEVAQAYGIKDIYGFMDSMDADENKDYKKIVQRLEFDDVKLAEAAQFTNANYPDVDLEFETLDKDKITAGEAATLQIQVTRGTDDDEEEEGSRDLKVHAPFYPLEKTENWWLVVGNESTRELLAIKRVSLERNVKTELEFTVMKEGKHDLTLFLICDSYAGVDQTHPFTVEAAPGEEDDEEDDEENEAGDVEMEE